MEPGQAIRTQHADHDSNKCADYSYNNSIKIWYSGAFIRSGELPCTTENDKQIITKGRLSGDPGWWVSYPFMARLERGHNHPE